MAFALALCLAKPASAQIIWTGNTSTDWNTGSNWSTGTVPGNTDTIVINQSGGNQPQVSSLTIGNISGNTAQSGNLSLSNGANVTANSLTQVGAGNVTIDGASSALYLQDLILGRSPTGVALMTVSNGGFVEANSFATFFLGVNNGEGTISVTGANSTFLISPSSNLFQGVSLGNGSITVANGGLITLGNASNISIGSSNPAVNRSTALNINTGGTFQVGGTDGIQGAGLITLAGGTLQVINSTLTTTVSGTLVANTTSTIDTNGLGAVLSGVLSGGGNLTKAGAGTLTLNATNTFTGNTSIGAGTLLLANFGALQNSTLVYNTGGGNLSFGTLTNATFGGLSGNQDLALANNSSAAVALTLGGGNVDTTYSGNLSGNGSLTKTGIGNLTLSGNNSYAGDTTISSGIFTFAGNTTSLGGNIADNTSLVFNQSSASTFAGVISGNGSLTQAGSANLTLSGANTFTGNTTISAGTLTLANSLALQNSTLNYNVGNGNLNFGNLTNVTLGGLSGNKDIILTVPAVTAVNLTVGTNNASTTFSGNLADSVPPYFLPGSLTKVGTGTLTLTGNLSYRGSTTVSAGTLTLSGASVPLSGQTGIGVDNGTVNIQNGSVLNLGSFFVGQLVGSNGTALVTGTNTSTTVAGWFFAGSGGRGLTTIANGANVTVGTGEVGAYAGGNGTLLVTDVGTKLTIVGGSGDPDVLTVGYQGNGTLTIANGATVTGNNGELGLFANTTGNATVSGANSTWAIAKTLAVGEGGTGNLSVANGGNVSALTGYIGGPAGAVNISGAGSVWNISGNINFAQTNGDIAAITQSGGTVSIGSSLIFGAGNGTYNLQGGTLQIGGTNAIQVGSGNSVFNWAGGTVQVTGADLTTSLNVTLVANTTSTLNSNGLNATWSGVLSGNGGLTKTGNGSLTLSANNTYTGATTLSAGTLTFSGSTSSLSGNIVDNANLTFNQTANSSFSGVISGNGTLIEAGTGNLTLTGNNTYAGDTTVSVGNLIVDGTSGGKLNQTSANLTLGNATTVTIQNGGNITNNNTILGQAVNSTGAAFITSGSGLQSRSSIIVGDLGVGNLSDAGFIGLGGGGGPSALLIGNGTGSNGTILLSGSIQGNAIVVGNLGTGSLNITSAGGINDGGNLTLGNGSTGIGTVLVTGADNGFGGELFANNLTIGNNGTGNLTMVGGANITSSNLTLGYGSSGNGTVLVADTTNATSSAPFTSLGVQNLTIGYSGTGNLTTANGGTVQAFGNSGLFNISVYLGQNAGSSGKALVTDPGSTWYIPNAAMVVGNLGTGNLTITNGGNVTVNGTSSGFVGNINVPTASAYLGLYNGSSGTMLVTGAGSKLSLTGALVMGDAGTGNLTIANGGKVTNTDGYIGTADVSNPTNSSVLVTGANSTWTNSGNLTVGEGGLSIGYPYGNGTLAISNGGNVSAAGMVYGTLYTNFPNGQNGTVTVDGAGSRLALSGNLNGGGNFTISNGGNVTVGGLEEENGFNGTTMLVTDPNSKLSIQGYSTIAEYANNTLTIANGAMVSTLGANSNNVSVILGNASFPNLTANATALVTGTNSTWNIGNATTQIGGLLIGNLGNGNLTIANGGLVAVNGKNLTFASGVNTTGTLNLNSGGTLQIGGTNAIQVGSGNAVFNWAGGTVQVSGANLTTSLNAILADNTTSTLNSNGLNATWSGVLSGNGNLTKTGNGSLTLNATNTFTGNTTISAGNLTLANSLALQNSTLNYNVGNGNLDFGNLTNVTLGGLSGNKDFALFFPATNSLNLTVGTNNASTTYSGNLTYTYPPFFTPTGSLTKVGTGTLTLTGNLSYNGGTTVNGGTLVLSGATDGSLTNVGIGVYNASLVIQNGSTLNLNGINVGVFNTINSTALITGPNTTITSPGATAGGLEVGYFGQGNATISNGANVTVSTVDVGAQTGGNGTLLVTDPGTKLVYNGQVDVLSVGLKGNGTMTIANGATVTGNNGVLGGFANTTGNVTVTDANSTWTIAKTLGIGGGGTGNLTIANGGKVSALTGYIGGPSTTVNISGAGSVWNISGNINFAQTNGDIAAITQSGGTVSIGSSLIYGAGNGTYNLQGGTLQIGGTNGIQAGSGNSVFNWAGGTVQVTGADLTTSLNATLVANTTSTLSTNGLNATWSGVLSGNGNLTKTGNGSLTLSANNTYTGTTTLSAGTLTFSGNTSNLTGNIVDNANLTFNQTADSSFSGVISGNGTLIKAGAGNLTLTGNNTYAGNTTVSTGNLIVGGTSGGGLSQSSANLTVGNTSGSAATVTIQNFGYITNNNTVLGQAANSTGTMLINNSLGGLGSLGDVIVGDQGIGNLTVLIGNIDFGSEGGSSALLIGNATGSNGTMLLSGHGQGNAIVVGNLGTGSLTITNAGDISSFGDLTLGYGSTGNGTMLVTGSEVAFSRQLYANNMTIGYNGTGNMTIVNGANIGTSNLTLGYGSTGNGTVLITGPSSDNTSLFSAGNLTIGYNGTGNLTTANGGTVWVNANDGGANISLSLGQRAGSSGTALVTDSGSTWKITAGGMVVGNFGTGNLTIANGGNISVTGMSAVVSQNTSAFLGLANGSSGTALVTDAGSKWSLAGALVVGYNGTGNLTITNGGKVTDTDGYVGTTSTTSPVRSSVVVTGTNSTWMNSGTLAVGVGIGYPYGNGTLTISNGGNVSAANMLYGQPAFGISYGQSGVVTVDGPGSRLSVSGNLNGADNLTVSNGGNVTIGGNSIQDGLNGATMLVTDPGSKMTIQGYLDAAMFVNTTIAINIVNGATLSTLGVTSNNVSAILGDAFGAGFPANGTALVTGTNSTWNIGNATTQIGGLIIGNLGNGNLTIANGGLVAVNGKNLTFASAANTTGTLNLNSGGTLQIGGTNAIQVGSGNASFNLAGGTLQVTGADLTTAINATLAANTTSILNTNGLNATWSGVLSGNGGLAKTGNGNLTLSGHDTFIGDITVATGNLTVSGSLGNLFGANSSNLTVGNTSGNSATLTLQNGALTTNGTMLGQAANSTGTVLLTGANANWNIGSLVAQSNGGLIVGNLGSGNLSIVNSMGLDVNGTSASNIAVSIGDQVGSHGNVTVSSNTSNGAGLTVEGPLTNSTGLVVGNLGVGTLTIDGSHAEVLVSPHDSNGVSVDIGKQAGSNGTVTIANGGDLLSAKALVVGDAGTGSLSASSGAFPNVNSADSAGVAVYIGKSANSTGSINLNNASFILNQDGAWVVGNLGNGSLTLANGSSGQVNEGNTTAHDSNGVAAYLGKQAGSTGNVLVTDTNSLWDLSSGSLVVGNLGSGTLTVANGGIVEVGANSTNQITLAAGTGSNGTINLNSGGILGVSTANGLVAGSGQYAFNFNGGTLAVGVGNFSTTLNATLGSNTTSTINTTNSNATWSGVLSGNGNLTKTGNSTLTLSGNNTYTGNTSINSGTLAFTGSIASLGGNIVDNAALVFNQAASGTFAGVISGNGTLTKSGNGTINLSANNTYTGNTTVNGGVLQFFSGGNIDVGLNGNSTLTIANGGEVIATNTVIAGYNSSDNGTVVVSGVNSTLYALGILVGGNGTGSLTVANGANVSTNAIGIARNSTNSTGTMLVTGANSTVSAYNGISVGLLGNANLTVANGGKISAAAGGLTISYDSGVSSVLVTDANSSISTSSDIRIGDFGTGNLTVANGGNVSDGGLLVLGWQNNGTVLVTDPNSTLSVANETVVGRFGNASLTVANGGTATVSTLEIAIPNNGTVLVTDPNSTLNAGSVIIDNGTGSLTMANGGTLSIVGAGGITEGSGNFAVNFAGGTLKVTGSDLTTSVNATLVNSTTSTLDTNGFNATWSGNLSGGGNLTKISAGVLTLSGNNTYTGNTTISTGTLLVSNDGTVSATGTGAVSVATNASLTGSGQIGGNTTVNGTLLPGTSGNVGLLSFAQKLTLGANATTLFQLGGTTRGTQYSAINIANNLIFGGALALNLLNNFLPALGTTFDLFQIGGSVSGAFANLTLPILNLDLGWDTSQLTTNGDLATTTITFTQWTNTAGLSGNHALASAKPFGGPANFLRYAMNLDLTATPAGGPSLSTANISGVNSLVIQYRGRKNMTDCQLVPQYSTDLANWTNVPAGNITQLTDADTYTAQYQASVALPANSVVFLRVVASPVP